MEHGKGVFFGGLLCQSLLFLSELLPKLLLAYPSEPIFPVSGPHFREQT